MNLFALLNRGAALAPPPPSRPAAVLRAVEKTRLQWLNALLVDQTRAWLDLGERQAEVVQGLAVLLTLASYVATHAAGGSQDTPDHRVLRGALSAAAQCAETGCVPTAADARAFSAAAQRADAIIRGASVDAILHATAAMRQTVGLL